MGRLAFISGVEGIELNDNERRFFADTKPLGLILFARNIETADQVKRLTGEVRDIVADDQFWVLIDQEGGRVQRLKPPLFPHLPPARRYGDLYKKNAQKALDAAFEIGQFMATRLLEFGINVNCTPVLDVPQPDAHEIIGDRSFALNPEEIALLGKRHAEGHMAGGVLPVIKHIPGHGRAKADSHLSLPRIDAPREELEAIDFTPFRALNMMPLAMTAHVVLEAFQDELPVSISSNAIAELIRQDIGFDGFLMCDDVSMQALSGSLGERTGQVLLAGCDGALHCNGNFHEMIEVAENSIELVGAAKQRFESSFAHIASPVQAGEEKALAFLAEEWALSS